VLRTEIHNNMFSKISFYCSIIGINQAFLCAVSFSFNVLIVAKMCLSIASCICTVGKNFGVDVERCILMKETCVDKKIFTRLQPRPCRGSPGQSL
jgi:hypothetical protein